jgi:hypothetical protein
VADNDASHVGENVAKETGLAYFLPPTEGDDLNDMHKRSGLFKTSQALRKWIATAGQTARP